MDGFAHRACSSSLCARPFDLVAAGPITWQLAMSSPFSEPVPAPGDLSEALGRPTAATHVPGPGLAISGVSMTYHTEDGPVAALGPVELHVPQGRFVTLIGPSGCGKSTLLRVLAGIERPDQGTISIFGESVEHARRAKLIGFVPQALALLPWRTVLENARLPLELNRSGATNRKEPARARARYFERSVSAMSSTAGPLSCRGGCDNVLRSARLRLGAGPFANGRALLGPRRADKRGPASRAPPTLAFDPHDCVVR